MKTVVVFAFLLTFLNAQLLVDDPNYCYTKDPLKLQDKQFGTVTSYDSVRGNVADVLPVTNCKPARFWLQARHGSRFPSLSDGDNIFTAAANINKKIVDNFVSMKTTLCDTDAKLLNEWIINPSFLLPTQALETDSGKAEVKAMGQRFRKAFPKLLPASYTSTHYYFRRSPITRTLETAQAFASGLFGDAYVNQVNYDGGVSPDSYLIPFSNCPEWGRLITTPIPEQQAFTQSAPYRQMLNQVNKKLGFTGSLKLTDDEIDKMITHCKYERMYDPKKNSAFCSAFSPANHQVSQYSYDLLNYFRSGYGFTLYKNLFENMSCKMVQTMLKFLQSKDPSEPVAKLWFGHDVSLQLVFVTLGLYKDEIPLRSGNFAQQTERKWKAGNLTPMGGNMAVIRYDCADGDDEVLFLHNEIPMQIPGCSANGMCKLSLILNRYARFLYANCTEVECSNTKLK